MAFFEIDDLVSYYGKVEVVSHVSIIAEAREAAHDLIRSDPDLAAHPVTEEYFRTYFTERTSGLGMVG